MNTFRNRRFLRLESLESREMLSAVQVDSWTTPVVLGDAMIFVGSDSDSDSGKELWITDGTESGTRLLKDIYSGSGSSNPSQLTLCGNVVYFTAKTVANGTELWKTDGTANGTILVKDIFSGSASSYPDKLTAVGSTLFFIADNGTAGTELWKSDGTATGTVLVKDIWSGSNSGCGWSSELCAVGNTLFFSAQTVEGNYELWKSDGTANGTTLIKDIRSGIVGSYPAQMIAVGSSLYFTADDGTTGTELWKSDGTATGTVLVKDIRSGSANSNPTQLTLQGSTLYFSANDGTTGTELWKSDGTASGTVLVKDIYPGSSGSNPLALTVFGNSLYFTANDGVNGVELWKTDGTSNGTSLLKNIREGSTGSIPKELTVVGGTLYFSANNGVNGTELWKSDGTTNGTMLVKDIRPGSTGSNPFHLTPFKGRVLFAATDEYGSAQLYFSDGTAGGTNRVFPYAILPTAIISPSTNLSVKQGETLLLSATNSVDPLERGLVYLWDLYGNGAFQETTQETILFSAAAVKAKSDALHSVFLKVRDAQGNESLVTQAFIYVEYLTPNYQMKVSEDVEHRSAKWTFTAEDFGRCGILSWIIDWGDGSAKTELHGGPRNTIELPHYYNNSGEYDITITTTDSDGIETTVKMGSYIVSRENPVLMASQSVFVQENTLPEESQTITTMSVIDETGLSEQESCEWLSAGITNSEPFEKREFWSVAGISNDLTLRQMLDLDQRNETDTTAIVDFWNTEQVFDFDEDFILFETKIDDFDFVSEKLSLEIAALLEHTEIRF